VVENKVKEMDIDMITKNSEIKVLPKIAKRLNQLAGQNK